MVKKDLGRNLFGSKNLGGKFYRVKKNWVGNFIGLKKIWVGNFKGLNKIWVGNFNSNSVAQSIHNIHSEKGHSVAETSKC